MFQKINGERFSRSIAPAMECIYKLIGFNLHFHRGQTSEILKALQNAILFKKPDFIHYDI